MKEVQQLNQANPPADYWERLAPPTSRDPEVLADVIERRLDGWGLVTFVEFAEWLGESYRGNCRLTDTRDPNIVYWGNLGSEIVEALNILIQAGRVELLAGNEWTNAWGSGINGLPLAKKRPPAAGYARPHWQPVYLILSPDRSRFNGWLCYAAWGEKGGNFRTRDKGWISPLSPVRSLRQRCVLLSR
jgi:hypothetical protein